MAASIGSRMWPATSSKRFSPDTGPTDRPAGAHQTAGQGCSLSRTQDCTRFTTGSVPNGAWLGHFNKRRSRRNSLVGPSAPSHGKAGCNSFNRSHRHDAFPGHVPRLTYWNDASQGAGSGDSRRTRAMAVAPLRFATALQDLAEFLSPGTGSTHEMGEDLDLATPQERRPPARRMERRGISHPAMLEARAPSSHLDHELL